MGHLVSGANGEQDVLNEVFVSDTSGTLVKPFTYVALLTSYTTPTRCLGSGYADILLNAPGGATPRWASPIWVGTDVYDGFWIITNENQITWQGGTDWGTIIGIGLANSAGVIFAAAPIGQSITAGNRITIDAAKLIFQFD